ncbi:hypothetical protein B0I72DRAFT_138022 [Yarrowia lipolytica]|uniref:Proteasome assembly chaperone 3 n=1 Tax=Yarrowia lipolytica TaxID=4952 RepID=A0A371BZI5_YARLL|nr:hypothetical protein B0I71DRAFT_135847 [Yarrowia lipolytica]RDW32498.1 hypothetical protein B0I72DRAFT_138022 [Yarrowia lipolytica]VBB89277.1 Hypothetical protein conserved in the Yarrowia clade [Yarrowia lipolytica]
MLQTTSRTGQSYCHLAYGEADKKSVTLFITRSNKHEPIPSGTEDEQTGGPGKVSSLVYAVPQGQEVLLTKLLQSEDTIDTVDRLARLIVKKGAYKFPITVGVCEGGVPEAEIPQIVNWVAGEVAKGAVGQEE